MAFYRYLAADLLTNTMLAELPLRDVSYGFVLNDAGPFQANMPIGDIKARAGARIAATEPGKTALYVERDGSLIWGGIIWTRRYNSSTRSLALGGAEFFSYYRRREIRTTLTYSATDQLGIVKSIIDTIQSVNANATIGVVVPTLTSGVVRDRTYWYYETKRVADAIRELAACANGFEFSIDCTYSGSNIIKTMNLFYPRKGRDANHTGHVFELGKNILAFDWPEDAQMKANSVGIQGAGQGDNMLRSTAVRADDLAAGYCLFEDTLARKDVSVQTTLDQIALNEVNNRFQAVTLPPLTVRADVEPQLGAWTVGDDTRIRIVGPVAGDVEPRFADLGGLDTFRRIIAATVSPGNEGQETVMITTGALLGT